MYVRMCALKSSGAMLQDSFYSSGPSRRVLCISMSKIALLLVCIGKVRHK